MYWSVLGETYVLDEPAAGFEPRITCVSKLWSCVPCCSLPTYTMRTVVALVSSGFGNERLRDLGRSGF